MVAQQSQEAVRHNLNELDPKTKEWTKAQTTFLTAARTKRYDLQLPATPRASIVELGYLNRKMNHQSAYRGSNLTKALSVCKKRLTLTQSSKKCFLE